MTKQKFQSLRLMAQGQAEAATRARSKRFWCGARTTGMAAAVVGLAVSTGWFLHRNARMRWAREEALPEIQRLVEKLDFFPAYDLAVQVEKILPTDPAVVALWPTIADKVSVISTPPGAEIYYKDYNRPESEWRHLGKTPVEGIRMARVFYRWQFRKEGYAVTERATSTGILTPNLAPAEIVPPEMLRVIMPETDTMGIAVNTGLPFQPLGAFLVDRYEVSNRQYKSFVDRGGYRERRYWRQRFPMDGGEISWEEALAKFRDTTGRPGPATWTNGTYPERMDDYPLTGVSWFEAAAYAEFAGKRLPSIYHWRRASMIHGIASIVPLSNTEGQALAECWRHQGVTRFGVYDMAGNAKEWCWNEGAEGKRYILGGAMGNDS